MKRLICIFIWLLIFSIGNNIKGQKVTYDIQSCFDFYIDLVTIFSKTNSKEDRKKLEEFAEVKLNPALYVFENKMCQKFDSVMFNGFIKLVLINNQSTDETPLNTLGAIFICHPSKTKKFISQIFDTTERFYIIKQIEFGFQNVSKNKPNNYEQHKIILEEMKRY